MTEITYNDSNVLIMSLVGVWGHILNLWCMCTLSRPENYCSSQPDPTYTHTPQIQNMPPNTDHAHDKYLWTTTSNFSQVEVITPWWWILCDPKRVGVIFNVFLLDFYITDFNVYECLTPCFLWMWTNVRYVYTDLFSVFIKGSLFY